MTGSDSVRGAPGRARKMTLRGHGAFVGGTSSDIPPPPVARGRAPRRTTVSFCENTR